MLFKKKTGLDGIWFERVVIRGENYAICFHCSHQDYCPWYIKCRCDKLIILHGTTHESKLDYTLC